MSKGDWPRPVNKKKFDEEFDRIFKKEKKKGGDSKVLNGDSRVCLLYTSPSPRD